MIFHPKLKTFSGLIDGKISDSKSDKIHNHLEKCEKCNRIFNIFEGMAKVMSTHQNLSKEFKNNFITNLPDVKRPSQPNYGVVKAVLGSIMIYSNGFDMGIEAAPGMALKIGDKIKVNDKSIALIELNDGRTIILNKNTEIKLTSGVYHLKIEIGEIFAMVKSQTEMFEIETPSAVLGVIGTDLYAKVTKDKETVLKVLKGKVLFQNKAGKIVVSKNRQVEASEFTKPVESKIKDKKSIFNWTGAIKPSEQKRRENIKKFGLIGFLIIMILIGFFYLYNRFEQNRVRISEINHIKNDLFPRQVLDYIVQFNVAAKKAKELDKNLTVNLQLFIVDKKLGLWSGFMGTDINTTNHTLTGEIKVRKTNLPNLYVFDESNDLLESRLVKVQGDSNSRYQLYATLQKPWHIGEERLAWGLAKGNERLLKKISSDQYSLKLKNCYVGEDVEVFCLVLPSSFSILQNSDNYTSSEKIGDSTLYIWQRSVYSDEEHIVDLVIKTK